MTEHISAIHQLIEALEQQGYAYPIDGDVYYNVRQFAEYGKLSGRKLEQLQAGAGGRVAPDAPDQKIGLSARALAFGRRIYGHGTRRYLEDALSCISMWLRMKKIDVQEWFVERSLLVLSGSIRLVFWFNLASLCAAYGCTEIGIRLH